MRSLGAIVSIILLTASVEAGAETLLLENAATPWWSPDGSELVCVRPAGSTVGGGTELWRVSATGGGEEMILFDPDGAFLPIWLPDGKRILYVRGGSPRAFVIHRLDGSSPEVFPLPLSMWDDYGVSLTPDATEVLYTTWGPPDEIWAMNITDGSTRFVREGRGGVISPDGEWLVFLTEDDTVAVEPLKGGEPDLIEPGFLACWTPDSEIIVFTGVSSTPAIDLIAVRRDGSMRWQLTDDPQWDLYAQVSPEGERVAFAKSEGEFDLPSIWLLDLDFGPTAAEHVTFGGVKLHFR